jgi:hypothetical protein
MAVRTPLFPRAPAAWGLVDGIVETVVEPGLKWDVQGTIPCTFDRTWLALEKRNGLADDA